MMELQKKVARQHTDSFQSFVRSIRLSLDVGEALATQIAVHCYPTVCAATEECLSSEVMIRVRSLVKVEETSFGMTLKTDQEDSFANHYIGNIEEGSPAAASGLMDGDELITLNDDFLGQMEHSGVIKAFHHIILGSDSMTKFAMVIRRNTDTNYELMKISFDLEIEDRIDGGHSMLMRNVDDVDGPGSISIVGSSFNFILRNRKLLRETIIRKDFWDCKIFVGPQITAEYYWTCENQKVFLKKGPSTEPEAKFRVHNCKANVRTGEISKPQIVSLITFEGSFEEESTLNIGKLGGVCFKKEHLKVNEYGVIDAEVREIFINHPIDDTDRQFAYESLGRRGSFLCRDGNGICLKRAEGTDFRKEFQFYLVFEE